jgi:hypothetical protein
MRLRWLLVVVLMATVLAACDQMRATFVFRPDLPVWAIGNQLLVRTESGEDCATLQVDNSYGLFSEYWSIRTDSDGKTSCKDDVVFALRGPDGTEYALPVTRVRNYDEWEFPVTTRIERWYYIDASGLPKSLGVSTPTPTPTPVPGATAEPTAAPTPTPVPTSTPTPAPLVFNTYPNVTVNATSAAGAAVTYDLAAFVQGGGAGLAINCVPASGSAFPIGTTNVACVAQDGARSAQSTFTVTITDGPPVLGAWGIGLSSLTATFSDGAPRVTYTAPTATDAVDGTATVTCTPASGTGAFAFGRNTITCRATDSRGNQSESATFSFGLASTLAAPVAPLGCPASGTGGSLPPIPMFLSGSVVLNGASAPDGTQVFVKMRNLAAGEGLTECWSTTSQVKLTSGVAFSSLVIAPPESTAGWFPVQFFVDGYLAATDYEITSGTFRGGQSATGITLTASSIPSTVNVVP